jgi:hypothetical protein
MIFMNELEKKIYDSIIEKMDVNEAEIEGFDYDSPIFNADTVNKAVEKVGKGALKTAENAMGQKQFVPVGKNIALGIVEGIHSGQAEVVTAVKTMAAEAVKRPYTLAVYFGLHSLAVSEINFCIFSVVSLLIFTFSIESYRFFA